MLNGKPVVFATSLDAQGPAVYRIGKLGHTLIATGEHLPTQLCLLKMLSVQLMSNMLLLFK